MVFRDSHLCQERTDRGIVADIAHLINPDRTYAIGISREEDVFQCARVILFPKWTFLQVRRNDQCGRVIHVISLSSENFAHYLGKFADLLSVGHDCKLPGLLSHSTGSMKRCLCQVLEDVLRNFLICKLTDTSS